MTAATEQARRVRQPLRQHKAAIVFPGQGAQDPSFGIPWRRHRAWEAVREAEDVLGRPLSHLLLQEAPRPLVSTADIQLSVFLSSMVAWRALEPELSPAVAFAGHSLGQYSALVAARAMDFSTGVRLVALRGELTSRSAAQRQGGMVALLGASLEVSEAAAAAGGCWVANDNAPGQVVLSGSTEGLEVAVDTARALGVRKAVRLAVPGAFHCPLMADAARAFEPEVARIPFGMPVAPVIANHDAVSYTDTGWVDRLVTHLVTGVQWRQSQQALTELGATCLVEVGPGATLVGLARRTVPQLPAMNVSAPDSVDSSLGAVS